MSLRILPLIAIACLSGCVYRVAEQTDRMIADMARRPFDRDPTEASPNVSTLPAAAEPKESTKSAEPAKDVQTAGYLDAIQAKEPAEAPFRFTVPGDVPGAEAPEFRPKNKEELIKGLDRLYPPLPPLPEEPKPLPRVDGKAYTLSELQEIAALNSPVLKQAAADVKAAEGTLVQARTYTNPKMGYRFDPSNDGSTAGVHGLFLDQPIRMGGKMKLEIAAAQKDLDNAELALKRARSDLSTQVRTAYFGLLVAKETVRVTRTMSVLTDEIYRAGKPAAEGRLCCRL